MMNLIAVTACQNVGHINWEPYIPMIFTRIMRSLDLPVCYKNTKSARNQSLWSSSIASMFPSLLPTARNGAQYWSSSTAPPLDQHSTRLLIFKLFHWISVWIASVLSPKSSAQHYLTKFLGAIESYLHPANSGKWLNVISEIVIQLPKYLFDRLIAERYKPHPWKKQTPSKFKIQFHIRFVNGKLMAHLRWQVNIVWRKIV